ncbi:O-antigen ligase family protein [Yanghanlia caeni]|uniref:O-antigen ligase family protein n=1 Tax=Yanghanlia caeni TaxID=3064283 RepID=A0ABU1D9C2_9BURK|nr:O-antigen ligase family protein [Alcaligenaceae bacterium LG-2]HZH56049.1 O-antigen ligase family protein [Burkholderiaceae bacterium]
MLMTLQLYYLAISGALFAYALRTPRHAVRAFPTAIALNVFPLALLPYLSMDIARLAGMPLVYLPVTAIGLALVARNGLQLPRRLMSLYIIACLYFVYTFINTVILHGTTFANFVYWVAWPLNIFIFIATASAASRMDAELIDRVLYRCVMVVTAAAVVGLLRFAAGIGNDANFMPVMNRNGTVVLLTLLFPLVFHVYETQGRSRRWLFVCAGTIALCVVLTFSRSGLIGLATGLLLYYGRLSPGSLLKATAGVLVLVMVLSSGMAQRSVERLSRTGTTLTALIEGRELDESMGDHNRLHLVNSALDAAERHFWLGTGLGMTNYREGLRRAGHGDVTSKAHNFFLSYFTELGLVGFALLMAMLQRIYAGLAPLASHQRAFRASFLVMAVMMTMNEYILLPELWLLFGLYTGISRHALVRHPRFRSCHA